MPREATLFESADGSVLKGYRLLQRGGANIPPMWIQRASESRCRLHKDVARALRRKSKGGAEHSQGMGNAVQQGMFLLRVARAPRIGEKRVRQD